MSDSKKTIKVDITVDLKYVNWSNPAQPTGQIEWTVAPTLLIIPTDDCTIQWNLSSKNAGGATVVFADATADGVAGIAWKGASNPGTPSSNSSTRYALDFNNTSSTTSTDWGYTINVKVSNATFSKVLSYDPDVENESPTNL